MDQSEWVLIGSTGTVYAHRPCGTVLESPGKMPDVCPRCEANKRLRRGKS